MGELKSKLLLANINVEKKVLIGLITILWITIVSTHVLSCSGHFERWGQDCDWWEYDKRISVCTKDWGWCCYEPVPKDPFTTLWVGCFKDAEGHMIPSGWTETDCFKASYHGDYEWYDEEKLPTGVECKRRHHCYAFAIVTPKPDPGCPPYGGTLNAHTILTAPQFED
ncbi:MAG: hypothetical protein DRJ49_06415 [Thermoprotei archaeon]|nr:MAG: hypothetical protein DRJ49_06415 [Thermoprotei archaeon]